MPFAAVRIATSTQIRPVASSGSRPPNSCVFGTRPTQANTAAVARSLSAPDLDLAMCTNPLAIARLPAERATALEHHDFRDVLTEGERLLHRRVAATHHHGDLVAQQRRIAARALAHAPAEQPLLA